MSARKPVDPELIDDDAPEMDDAWFAKASPAREVLPQIFPPALAAEMLKPKRGRPPKTSPKTQLTLRVDTDVLEAFRAGGAGWQTRMNDALREWLDTHPQTARG